MSGRVVDAKCYSGSDELEQEREKAERTLGFFVTYCNNRGLAAKPMCRSAPTRSKS